MSNSTDSLVYGWAESDSRGTMRILSSCGATIILCCWVSVYPNVGSPSDKWYHQLLDKFNLFCIALLGPEFLFGIALGQWSKAKESVKLFNNDPPLNSEMKWTQEYAFFVNAGGIHLKSPDFPQGFPIDAQQLHYLLKNEFVAPLDMESMDISERNSAGSLSRVITAVQTFWFFAGVIQRVYVRLPVTTLELTASSFAFIMFATSAAWYYKPSITRPRYISTEDSQTVQSIRDFSQLHTHCMLPGQWYQTPLEYLSQERFGINLHWSYYTRFAHMIHLRVFSRPVSSRPWNRFHSDSWLCPSLAWAFPAFCITVIFSISFIVGWDSYFPTSTETIMWKVFCVYHAAFSISGAIYYVIEMFRSKKLPSHSPHSQQHFYPVEGSYRASTQTGREWSQIPIVASFLDKWRATLPNQDPDARIPFRVLIPITIISAVYSVCRLYLYIEVFVSLREQPSAVYDVASVFA